jgi:hypothetical protein
MQNLRNNLITFLFILVAGCQSAPVFEVQTFLAPPETKLDDRHVIRIQSNRVQQQCLFLSAEAENRWRHQYFLYLLTDKNEVLPVMYNINQDGEGCQKQIKKIQKILNQELEVKVCANSQLNKRSNEVDRENWIVQFERLGSHKVIYDALFLDAICNSKNCFAYNEVPGCSGITQKSDRK